MINTFNYLHITFLVLQKIFIRNCFFNFSILSILENIKNTKRMKKEKRTNLLARRVRSNTYLNSSFVSEIIIEQKAQKAHKKRREKRIRKRKRERGRGMVVVVVVAKSIVRFIGKSNDICFS